MRLLAIIIVFFMIGTAYGLAYNISIPAEVDSGKWFSVNVSAVSEKDLNLTLYSYVYKGFNCVGQDWTANKKEVFLIAGETKQIELKDLVKQGTEQGIYDLRVKLKFDNETLNETYSVIVNSKPEITPIYLYIGLVVVSLVGLYLIFKRG
jgi:hypothetical protein